MKLQTSQQDVWRSEWLYNLSALHMSRASFSLGDASNLHVDDQGVVPGIVQDPVPGP